MKRALLAVGLALSGACAAAPAPKPPSAPTPSSPTPSTPTSSSASSSANGLAPEHTAHEVCLHLQKLGRQDEKGFVVSMDKCLANLEAIRARDPAAFTCVAHVVPKLNTIDTALLAISVCDKNKPQKPAPED